MSAQSVLAGYRSRSAESALHRRMGRILAAMIEGGVMMGKYDGELICEGGRWYVGPTAVNPAAARRLRQLGLVHLVAINPHHAYAIPESARQRIIQLQAVARGRGEVTIDIVCTTLIHEASERSADRRSGSHRNRDPMKVSAERASDPSSNTHG
jgi:hypothetical protein